MDIPTISDQLASKLIFERERSAKLNQYAIDLHEKLKAEQEENKRLNDILKQLVGEETNWQENNLQQKLESELSLERQKVEHLKNALYKSSSMIRNGNPSNEQLEEVIVKATHGLQGD